MAICFVTGAGAGFPLSPGLQANINSANGTSLHLKANLHKVANAKERVATRGCKCKWHSALQAGEN